MQDSLREFVSELYGQEIDWLESKSYDDIPQLMYTYSRKENTLFIKNLFPYNFSFVTNLLGSRTMLAKVLRCSIEDIHKKYLEYLGRPLKPILVTQGACQEQVYLGDEINLGTLPAPKFNRDDVAPYITAGIVIAKDPQTLSRNVSINRMQFKGPAKLGIRMEPTSHLYQIQQIAEAENRDLPVAIVIGNHPAELLAAVSSIPYGADELEIAGAIRGEALELVKCKTVDLEVPAGSEIVIEGYIPHHQKELEGPFGDFMGYYIEPSLNHIIHVTAITHRLNKPIFQSIRAGSLEDALLLGLAKEAAIYKALLQEGIDVTKVNVSPMVFTCIISINKASDYEPAEVIRVAFDTYQWLKYCIVVDEDVNCYDLNDVWWAISTRSTPKKNVLYKDRTGFERDPYHIHEGKMGIDATVPLMLRKQFRRAKP